MVYDKEDIITLIKEQYNITTFSEAGNDRDLEDLLSEVIDDLADLADEEAEYQRDNYKAICLKTAARMVEILEKGWELAEKEEFEPGLGQSSSENNLISEECINCGYWNHSDKECNYDDDGNCKNDFCTICGQHYMVCKCYETD